MEGRYFVPSGDETLPQRRGHSESGCQLNNDRQMGTKQVQLGSLAHIERLLQKRGLGYLAANTIGNVRRTRTAWQAALVQHCDQYGASLGM